MVRDVARPRCVDVRPVDDRSANTGATPRTKILTRVRGVFNARVPRPVIGSTHSRERGARTAHHGGVEGPTR